VNLGWKLAQVVHGVSPESLLDTYQAERHPVGARVLKTTLAQTAITRGDARTTELREVLSELFKMEEPRKRYAARMSGLDISYDLGAERGSREDAGAAAPPGAEAGAAPDAGAGAGAPANHPLLGRRMPDLDLDTREGPRRVFSLLREARPVLVNLGQPGALDISPWAGRVQRLDASYAGAWELPVLGAVAAPAAVLIRPDGHVAWVGDGTDRGLRDALTRWFGA
jgi:3-(3-hydroxy-phenyl)propionate hydroxylase